MINLEKYFLFIFLIVNTIVFSQKADTVQLRKDYCIARDIESEFPDSALKMYNTIVKQFTSLQPNKTIGVCYHRIAELVFLQNQEYGIYFNTNYKGIKNFEGTGDSVFAMNLYENLGQKLAALKRFPEAINYHKKCFSFGARNKSSKLFLYGGMSLADCYSSLNKNDSALVILFALEKDFPNEVPLEDLGSLYSNIANTYLNASALLLESKLSDKKIKTLKNALNYGEKSKEIYLKDLSDSTNLSYIYGLLGQVHSKLGNFEESEKNFRLAIPIQLKYESYFELETSYFEMTELQIKKGNTAEAILFFNRHDSLSKAIFSNQSAQSISEMKTLFETEKKEKENVFLQESVEQQKLISYFIIGGLIMALALAFFIFRGLKQQRAANKIISEQKNEVELQKHLIEEHQKEIIDSIRYARRIQQSLLPTEKYIAKKLSKI